MPTITAYVELPEKEIAGPVEFIIDTGSSQTVLLDRDVIRLGINVKKLKKAAKSIGIGGEAETFQLGKAKLYFKTENGSNYTIEKEMYAIRHSKLRGEAARRIISLPSILGMDFIKEFKLIINSRDGEVLLIKEEN